MDRLRLSDVALLDGSCALEASGYTRRFRDADWTSSPNGSKFADILTYPEKIYMERVEQGGEFYDVCAVARQDAPGILVGFYRQPAGLIADTESDLENLLTGLRLEREGCYAIAEGETVLVTSDDSLTDSAVADSDIISQLAQISEDSRLHQIRAGSGCFLGCRSACENYSLYIYYPMLTVFFGAAAKAAVFAAVYSVLCLLYFAVRHQTLYENQEELKASNHSLMQTVEMLRALQTIYFSLFFVDLEANTYNTIYVAPWLTSAVSQSGVYTELKQMFMDNMIVPSFCDEIDRRMSIAFIRENLSREKLTEVRKSFYTDYQAIRGKEIRWCRVSVTVVDFDDAGKPLHVLALIQDIDREKAKEADYQAQILKEAHEAKVANEAKADFLRRMSHDFRTPINGIQGYIDMAARHPDDLELQAHCREKASTSLHILLELINGMLDMSKLQSADIVLEEKPFDLSRLLDDINTILMPQAVAKNVRFEKLRKGPVPITHLLGSPRHVSQIILNITANAVKYARPGGYVRVNTKRVSQTADTVTYMFICEDNGVGMSEEFQSHMFEPFSQETVSARSSYEGVGMGLSIAKRLADAMGGTITCTSEKGVGTTFRTQITFRIDRQYYDNAAPQRKENGTVKRGLRLLLAEDNELNMEIAECILQEHGEIVTRAWNGKEAVDIFAASPPGSFDVILMDIMMPEMDGLDAARAIRAMDRPDAGIVPIFAMSANSFSDDVQSALDAGMNGHIPKPIDPSRLLEILPHEKEGEE